MTIKSLRITKVFNLKIFKMRLKPEFLSSDHSALVPTVFGAYLVLLLEQCFL